MICSFIPLIFFNTLYRYTVHYTEEDSTQNHVSEDMMRKLDDDTIAQVKKDSKGRSQSSPTKKSVSESDSKKRKHVTDKGTTSNKRSSSSYVPNPQDLQLAQSMGLPEGWAAKSNGKGMYSFRSPDGKTRIEGKRAVFKHLGMDKPRNFYPRSSKSSAIQYKEQDEDADDDIVEDEEDKSQDFSDAPAKKATSSTARRQGKRSSRAPKEDEFWEEEGDDPPWRITGHEFIGKKIVVDSKPGMIVGWIAETDVDKNGQPGYVSETDGKPAALFHVEFDSDSAIESQDFEEYEILNYLLQGKE